MTADAGYHSDANVQHLLDNNIPAMIADNQMRSRDERFESQAKYKNKPDPLSEKKAAAQPKEVKRIQPKDFHFNEDNTATCPAGKLMMRAGTIYTCARGNIRHNKRINRLNHRGRIKVNTQWNLYCMVHNIEKLARTSLGQQRVQ